MDPKDPAPELTSTGKATEAELFETQTAPGIGPLIVRSPFDVVTGHVSAGLVDQALVRPSLGDGAMRRFSSPAYNENRQRLTTHVISAKEAYAKAFVAIQKSLKSIDATANLKDSTRHDVEKTALKLFRTQTGDEKGPVSTFLGVLHHYHGVFDVLSQAGDFGYLAVIWGGMKTLLIVSGTGLPSGVIRG